jgi:hypothetical protein
MKKIFVATGSVVLLLMSTLAVVAQVQSREDILKDIETKRAELSALEKLFLSPSEEDRSAYAEFLRMPDTGLVRILPRETYDSEVYKDNKKTISFRGGGAYYSFTARSHDYNAPSDIGLERGQLTSGFAGANYGMLIDLGEVPIENVSLETAGAQALAMHTAATEEPQARVEQQRASSGTTIEGGTYKRHLPLKLNSTYVVRSIIYRASDALVVFKVVRVDTDGSAILVWKLLKKYPVPNLARIK